MIKILYILGKWSSGGIEKVLTTYFEFLPKDKYELSVFAFGYEKSVFDEVLIKNNIKLLYPQKDIKGNYITKNIRRIKGFNKAAKSIRPDIIHYNTAFAMAYIHCYLYKLHDKKVKIILHAHGDNVNKPHIKLKRAFNYIIKNIFQKTIDCGIACSKNSGKWLFSKKLFESKKYHTVCNAIKLETMRFNEEKRASMRTELQIPQNAFVFGTIGRFEYQKNPSYIFDIIKGVNEKRNDIHFIWVGMGAQRNEIIHLVNTQNFADNIHFIDSSNDIQMVLSVMDLFILPSKYEGLGLVLLEAQANGLQCLTSDVVPQEAKVTSKIHFLSLNSLNVWVEKICEVLDSQDLSTRIYPATEIKNYGYEINDIIEKLIKLYDTVGGKD